MGTLVIEQHPAPDEVRTRARDLLAIPSMQRPRHKGPACTRRSGAAGLRRGAIASVVGRFAKPVKTCRRRADPGGAR